MKNPEPCIIKTWNCRQETDWLMDGYCLSQCFIYKASLNTTTNKYYYCTFENIFKERYKNHK